MVNDKVEPALTAEEWCGEDGIVLETTSSKAGHFVSAATDGDGLSLSVRGPQYFTLTDDDCARIIALANHALPDDHPLKITREDVRMLRDVADSIDTTYDRGQMSDPGLQSLIALSNKLAALLPPADG